MSAKAPNKKAFTIVELLTVMGVIAILIGLLVPALGLVRDYAKEIQQRAQFHTIEAALEMFNNDFGEYPESYENDFEAFPPSILGSDTHYYGGAQKLAEAMVGLDFLGYHPNSLFRADNYFLSDDPYVTGTNMEALPVYHAEVPDVEYASGTTLETAAENIQARKGPYIDLEYANAYKMYDIYDIADLTAAGFKTTDSSDRNLASIVLTDVFTKKRETGQKTGMPILYFRARDEYIEQDSLADTAGGAATYDDDIYNLDDNLFTLQLGTPEGIVHPLVENSTGVTASYSIDTDDLERFDKMIINPKVTAVTRPFRAESYILISAGKDGLFGTPDDIFNFTKEQ